MKKAIYADLDPPTFGHLWMIEESAKLFDEVVVAIGVNPEKKSAFTLEQRIKMLEGMVSEFNNVSVSSFGNQYLVSYADYLGANVIVRGIRNANDYEYEKAMRNVNAEMNPSISTVILITPKDLSEVSSSFVKGLVGPHDWERVVAKYVPKNVVAHFVSKKDTLWNNLVQAGAVGDEMSFWNSLVIPYLDSNRHYHCLSHIHSILDSFQEIKHLIDDSLSVETAIWFHDIVYDTNSANPHIASNEERSAYKAVACVENLGLTKTFPDKVSALILSTKHNSSELDNDAKYLVDLDLLILGQESFLFDEYEGGIRKEYSFVPSDIFKQKRVEILEGFLHRPSIYLTEYFREKYEAKARENLNRSIKKLVT